ncbi:MAG: hypothetical protein KF842_05670 [Caulobacter sp.]|nr:hypothetical protein [Caulobacter sp.]
MNKRLGLALLAAALLAGCAHPPTPAPMPCGCLPPRTEPTPGESPDLAPVEPGQG